MKGLRVDGGRALRVAAGVGLAALVVSVLPGLLAGPETPPLPPDVGFRPSERRPLDATVTPTPGPMGPAADPGKARGKTAGRKDRGRARDRGKAGRAESRKRRGGRQRSVGRASKERADSPAPVSPAPTGSPPIPTPPAVAPPVNPRPLPAVPSDGSEEFAPRIQPRLATN